MIEGKITAIYIAPTAGAPMEALQEAVAVVGKGLEGDRYSAGTGTYSKKPHPDRQVTLMEEEALEALRRDYGQDFSTAECRRNLITRGVALNHLVGRTIRVGEVLLRAHRLCDPCKYLERVTGKTVYDALIHRGGLRAEILEGGTVRPGDTLVVTDP